MRKGDIAKQNVLKKIQECFGDDYVNYIDKKIYVTANDGNDIVQIALSMTCPKVEVEKAGSAVSSTPEPKTGAWTSTPQTTPQITQAEKDNIKRLRLKFNL